MVTYWELLQAIVKKNSARPLYTWLSDAGRIELSAVTFMNAVSKASNFLTDGLDLEPPVSVEVSLGNHWQSPVWLGAALSIGSTITDKSGDFMFAPISEVENSAIALSKFVAISTHPFGVPDKSLPQGCIDGSTEVRNFGDVYLPFNVNSKESISVTSHDKHFTWQDIESLSSELIGRFNLVPGESFGIVGKADLSTTVALQVAIPVIYSSQVVLIDQLDADVDSIVTQEKLSKIVYLD